MPRTATRPTKAEVFTEADAYKTWRVVSANKEYSDKTETFGFSNGQAVIPALPKTTKCNGLCTAGDINEDCRLHNRVLRLNNLRNYPTFRRVQDPQSGRRRTDQMDGYRVLSEDEYEREFGDVEPDSIDLDDF